MTVKVQNSKVPPDGGWGWLVVLGASLVNFSTRAIDPSFGLLFGDLLKELKVETTGASIATSTHDSIYNFSGLFVGPFMKRMTYRKVSLLGALISSASLILAAYSRSMFEILITYGIIGGIGFGLEQACSMVAVNMYFEKKKGQAVGLAMAGTAFGFMLMPQIISFLLNQYDFRSALVVLGAISLNSVVGSALFQPLKWHLKPANQDEEKEALTKLLPPERKLSLTAEKQDGGRRFSGPNPVTQFIRKDLPAHSSTPLLRNMSTLSNVSLVDITGSSVHIDYLSKNKTVNNENNEDDTGLQIKGAESESADKSEEDVGCWTKFCKFFDLNLLTDWVYLNILYGMSVCMAAEINFRLIIPFFMDDLGYTKSETANALSMMAIADILARVTVPLVLDRLPYSKRITLLIGYTLVAICRSLFAELTGPISLMVLLVAHGFFRGFALINNPLVLAEYANDENFPAVLGLSMVSKGIFIAVLGPLGGFIRDYTQSYEMYIHFHSLLLMSMVFTWSIELAWKWRKSKTKSSRNLPNE